MRIILIFLALSFNIGTSFSQQISSSVFDKGRADTIISARSYELDYIRDCLREYHKERQNFIIAGSISVGATIGSMVVKTEDTKKTFLIAGGISGIISLGFLVDAEKWIKRSTIKPSSNGAGIEIYFNRPKNKRKVTQKEFDDLYY